MKKRILILALALAVIMNTMPVFAMTEAEETTDTAQTAVQQEEMIEEAKEEPSMEAKAEEEAPQKAEAETETAPTENNDQVSEEIKPEAQEQEKTETTTPDAAPVKSTAKKTLGSSTAAQTLKVVWHFNILGEDGEYKEVKAYTQSVKSGAKTTNIALTTATSYVKPSSVVIDGKTYNYVTSWKDAAGNTVSFPLTRTYDEIADLAGDGTTTDIQLYAQYRSQIKITLHFNEVRRTNGTIINTEQSNNISGNGGWSFTKKKLENATGLRSGDSFTYEGYRYTYTGKWIDANDNIIDSSSSIALWNKDGHSSGNTYYLNEDTDLYFMPIYDKTMIQGLDYFYIDNISTGSGSWSNRNSEGVRSDFSALTHTFKDPEDGTPQDHYNFEYWKNDETGDIYKAGESFTYKVDSSLPEGTVTEVKMYAYWQPSVIVNYHVNGETVKSVESFDESIEAYGFVPELEAGTFTGWYASEEADAEKVAEDMSYSAPEITKDADSMKTIDLYAGIEVPVEEPDPEQPGEIPESTEEKTVIPADDKDDEKKAEDTKKHEGNDKSEKNDKSDKNDRNSSNETEDTNAPAMVITDQNTPQAPAAPGSEDQGKTETINDGATPLAMVEDSETPMAGFGAWALVNLILTIVTILGSLAMMIGNLRRRKENEDEETLETKKRRRIMRSLTIVPAIAALIAFIITEDMSLPMVLTDKWTILMAVIAIAQAALMLFARDKKEEERYEEEMITA